MARRRIIKSQFANALNDLKTHLRNCLTCRVVMKSVGLGDLCREGRLLVFRVASFSGKLATLHRQAYDHPNNFIYACPDRTRHGVDYATTAEPHILMAVQERLF